MSVLLNDVRTALAIELGEETVTSSWPASRDSCIQWSLERLARYYDFDFGMIVVTSITGADGTLALPATIRRDPELDVRIVNAGAQNDFVFLPIVQAEFDDYPSGSYRYYLSTAADGTQTLVTTEASVTLTITGSSLAPVISATVPTNFPSALAIAKGALIYVREFEDKDADTSVEDAKFMQIVGEVIGAEQRNRGAGRAKSVAEIKGHHIGEVNGPWMAN